MPHWGMVIDLKKCTGCQVCIAACQQENNIFPSTEAERIYGRAISWIQFILMPEHKSFMPVMCMHCKKPPCVKVCPVGATFKSKNGIVGQIYERCIGCRYCVAACPYNVKYFNWYDPKWPKDCTEVHNPDVTVRPRGVVEKCTFCHHRLQKVKEKKALLEEDLKDGDYNTACSCVCPTGAIAFGDFDDPHSEVAQRKHEGKSLILLEELGTEPSVIYLV